MLRRKCLGIASLVMVLLLSSVNAALVEASDSFLLVTIANEKIMMGEDQTIRIELTDCSMAFYAVIVFSPGDLELSKSLGYEFIEWLEDYWESHTYSHWNDFLNKLNQWYSLFKEYNLDVAVDIGALMNGWDQYDTLTYFADPNDFHNKKQNDPDESKSYWWPVINDPGTYEIGNYDIVVVGVALCGKCCVSHYCFHTSFNVVPEFAIGTIAPIITSLGGLGLLGLWGKRRKEN